MHALGAVRDEVKFAPTTLREANTFVELHHRHHKPVRGCIFNLALAEGDDVVGVAIVGRPVARRLQDGWTCEVLRLCVLEGHMGGASKLLSRARRVAGALGYRRLVTYTLPEEGGASLRGAGYRLMGTAGGGTWDRKDRPRVDLHPTQLKLRWEVTL